MSDLNLPVRISAQRHAPQWIHCSVHAGGLWYWFGLVLPLRDFLENMIYFCLTLLLSCVLSARSSAPRDSCASCRVRTHAQPELVEAVKRHILSRLQMSARPNITRPLPKAAMVTALRRLHAGKLREDGRVEIPSLAGHAFSTEAHAETSEIISFAESGKGPLRLRAGGRT